MSFIFVISIILFMILCALLCFVILIQDSKATGLGSTFGGDTSDSLFGTSTSDVLKKFTAWLAVLFLVSCVLLSLWTSAMGRAPVQEGELPQIEELDPNA